MSLWQFILRSLTYHVRMHLAVALGVASATAVLTGALVVGDSVRGSLRHLALDRLGMMDEVLLADRFFRAEMAGEITNVTGRQTAPAILLPSVTAEVVLPGGNRRASGVMLVGCDEAFWRFDTSPAGPKKTPAPGEIILNEPLAAELGARVGDQIIVRLPKSDQIPAESALGKKQDRLTSLAELRVAEIIPAQGLGRFSLLPLQSAPRNAYVAASDLQQALFFGERERERVNAVVIGGSMPTDSRGADVASPSDALTPTLADYGLSLKHVRRTFTQSGREEVVLDYFSLSSDRLLLDERVVETAQKLFPGQSQPVLTYLANTIEKVGEVDRAKKPIPYSTITAIEPAADGPLIDDQGKPLPPLAPDEIALTSWSTDDLGVRVGDKIRVHYFEPESTHGQTKESSAEFRLVAIIPLTEPSKRFVGKRPAQFTQRPTRANDPDLTPAVKGFTDQETIDNWEPPFPYDDKKLRRPRDDDYWANHRTTPKAYVSLATGQKLWGSRFGKVTSVRIPAAAAADLPTLEKKLLEGLRSHAQQLGFVFLPLREQSLRASSGTTPFDFLFLALSMFIIAAALLLVWILFRLGVEQRAGEIGTLQALGWRARSTARVLTAEGGLVAALGALLGVAAGVGYAWLMLEGLRTWWVGAITTPFLVLHVNWLTLLIGYASGVIVCLLTISFSLRSLRRVPTRSLMAGVTLPDPNVAMKTSVAATGLRTSHRMWRFLPYVLILLSLGLAIVAANLGGEAQAGAFMSSGGAILWAMLLLIASRLRGGGDSLATTSLPLLAFRNAGRNVGRSVTTIGLMAAASFLIVAVSAFQLDPTEQGVGGFDLLAESSEPILIDLNSPEGRRELLAGNAGELDGTSILSLRLRSGDDASCRNLYQSFQPRIWGVPAGFVAHFDEPGAVPFSWGGSAAKSAAEKANPWHLLEQPAAAGEPVNVILDKNTAMYSLKKYGGIGEEFEYTYDDGPTVKFKVVGLLANSVLQGSLLIGEADFKRLFPQVSGYRAFLIRAPADKIDKVAAMLESRLGDEGFDTVRSRDRLAELLAVQNTYISTFRSLGALGLLLGTFGLAAVQLRNVLERRKELALFRAVGYGAGRLGGMVLLENLVLLLGGLLTGTLAALFSVLPHMYLGGAHVPLAELGVMLGAVLIVGIGTGLIAVRATLQAPLLAALRGE